MSFSEGQVLELLNAIRQEQNQMTSTVKELLNSQQERINQLENKTNLFEEIANKVGDLKAEVQQHSATMKGNFKALIGDIKELEISSKAQGKNLLGKVNRLEIEVQTKQEREVEKLVEEIRSVGQKVYDFQPSLLAIVRAQNEIQKIQREIHTFATHISQKEEEDLANRQEISNQLEGLKTDIERQSMKFEDLAKSSKDNVLEKFSQLEINVRKVATVVEKTQKVATEDLLKEIQNIAENVGNFHPSLLAIETAQNEIQKIQREIQTFVTKHDAQVSQKEEEDRQRNIQELANREEISNRLEGLKADFERQAVTLESLAKSSKVQEVLDEISVLETDLRKEIQNVGRKVCEFHPSLVSIENVQNEVQKMQMDMKTIINLKFVQKEIQELLNSLVGSYSWMKPKIFVINGRIQTCEGKTLSLEECKNAIENKTPWTLFPEEYEVECRFSRCKKLIPVSSNLREDKISVECPSCNSFTPLGSPKQGFEWGYFFPCFHFHQVPIGQRPENCLFCGKEGRCSGPQNEDARIPMRK